MPIGSPLTGAQLYQLFSRIVTNGQSDTSIDYFTFFNYLNIVKNEIEAEREWNILKAIDKSKTWTPSDTFLTPKAMPQDWNFWQSENQIALVQASNVETYELLPEITMQKALEYQEQTYRFYADYAAGNIFICGNATMTYQIWQYYIKSSPDFNMADTTWVTALEQTWVFPGTVHQILPMYAAAMYKSGLNYDQINANQAIDNYKSVESMKRWLAKWDGRIQAGALRGINRGYRDSTQFISGHVNINNDADWE